MKQDEIFDVVNEQDEVIGTATRKECHSNADLIHHTVHFTLRDPKTEKILITRYPLTKEHDAGKFCFLGEHIVAGESYPDAARRGCLEELGIEIVKFEEKAHHIFKYQNQTEFVRFFLGKWNGTEIHFDSEEIAKIIWIERGELKKGTYDFSEMTQYWIDHVKW